MANKPIKNTHNTTPNIHAKKTKTKPRTNPIKILEMIPSPPSKNEKKSPLAKLGYFADFN